MEFTSELCKLYNLSPFDVLKQDKDEVIMLVNYFIEKGQNSDTEKPATQLSSGKSGNNGRIRVNDSTATGGWF